MSCERLVVMKTAHHHAQGKPGLCDRVRQFASITFNFLCATKYENNLNGPTVNYNGNERTVVFIFFWWGGFCCNCNELGRLGIFYARIFWHSMAEMLLAMWFFLLLFK